MKDIITTLTEKLGQKLCNDKNLIHDEIDEGMSINDFNKLMRKIKRSGVNLNQMSASKFLYTMYKAMDPSDFRAFGIQIDQSKKELKKAIVSCGGSGWDDDEDYNYSCGGGGRSGCGYSTGNDDDYGCGGGGRSRSYC